MKRFVQFILVLPLVSGLLAACAAPNPTPVPATPEPPSTPAAPIETEAPDPIPSKATVVDRIIITDTLGRAVEFNSFPNRIFITSDDSNALLDTAFLFSEAPERIMGYELHSQAGLNFIHTAFPQSRNMTVLDADAEPEQIALLNPDLVLMKSTQKQQLGDHVELLGIKVIYLNLVTADAINNDIRTLGTIFGNAERAEQLVSLYDQARTRITDVTSTIPAEEKPSTLLIQYSDKGGEVAFSVPTGSYLQTQLVEMAGGSPIWKDVMGEGWSVITPEQIAAWNPEIIILIDYKGKAMETVDSLQADENWQQLDAVKNGKLYAFPLDFQSWDQPDSRWILGLAWLATKLQPERFDTLKMYQEIPAFYTDFYGLSESAVEQNILPLVKGDF